MAMQNKVVWQKVPNLLCRVYGINELLIAPGANGAWLRFNGLAYQTQEALTAAGKRVVEGILGIPGVNQVTIDKYEIDVSIAPVFDWEDDAIHQKILQVLTSIFSQPDEVSVQQTVPRYKADQSNCDQPCSFRQSWKLF